MCVQDCITHNQQIEHKMTVIWDDNKEADFVLEVIDCGLHGKDRVDALVQAWLVNEDPAELWETYTRTSCIADTEVHFYLTHTTAAA
jgi:hypothetical protein